MTAERRGRPRRFDDDTERRILLDAAMDLLRSRGYAGFGIADVLEAAGLSTRSFYRHFDSKDALHSALLRREIESVARHLQRVVTESADPAAGVLAWIDAFLDTFFDPRLADRSAAFTAPAAVAGSPLVVEMGAIRSELCRSLESALRAGRERGVIDSVEPELDARAIYGVVTALATPPIAADRTTMRGHVLRLVAPLIGTPTRREPA